jgi:hypothetical protein
MLRECHRSGLIWLARRAAIQSELFSQHDMTQCNMSMMAQMQRQNPGLLANFMGNFDHDGECIVLTESPPSTNQTATQQFPQQHFAVPQSASKFTEQQPQGPPSASKFTVKDNEALSTLLKRKKGASDEEQFKKAIKLRNSHNKVSVLVQRKADAKEQDDFEAAISLAQQIAVQQVRVTHFYCLHSCGPLRST